jgi:hypothetical protein
MNLHESHHYLECRSPKKKNDFAYVVKLADTCRYYGIERWICALKVDMRMQNILLEYQAKLCREILSHTLWMLSNEAKFV